MSVVGVHSLPKISLIKGGSMFKKLTKILLIFLLAIGFVTVGKVTVGKVNRAEAEQEDALYGVMTLWDATIKGLPQGYVWNVPGVDPQLYTEIPMNYPQTKSIYVVFGDDGFFYVSEDKKFEPPLNSPDEKVQPGEFFTLFDENADGTSKIKDEIGNEISVSGEFTPYVGKTFQIGWVDFMDSNGDHIANFHLT